MWDVGCSLFIFYWLLWFCPPSSGRDKSLHYAVDTKNGYVVQGCRAAFIGNLQKVHQISCKVVN